VPPIPGIRPRETSGSAKNAFYEATMISLRSANSNPPPKAFPLTADMIGFFVFLNAVSKGLKI
jgi:hypothetical protein